MNTVYKQVLQAGGNVACHPLLGPYATHGDVCNLSWRTEQTQAAMCQVEDCCGPSYPLRRNTVETRCWPYSMTILPQAQRPKAPADENPAPPLCGQAQVMADPVEDKPMSSPMPSPSVDCFSK